MTTADDNQNLDLGTPTPEPGGTPTPAEVDATPPQPEGDETPPAAAASTEDQTPPNPPPMPEWMKKRLADTTAKRHEAERRAAAAEAKLAEVTKSGDEPPAPETDINKLAEARAAELVAAREFNRACNEIAAKGKAEFEDFDASLKNFDILGGLTPQIAQLALETDNPSKVLYELSKDLEKAAEIFSLPPLKQVKEILKFEAKIGAKAASPAKAVSRAPDPIEPKLGGGSRASTDVNLYDDNVDTKAWIEARNKQLRSQSTVH